MVIGNILVRLAVTVFFLSCLANEVAAQVSSIVYLKDEKKVSIYFVDDIVQADLGKVLIFFKDDNGDPIRVLGDAQRAMSNSIDITNFRIKSAGAVSSFDLEMGGGGIPAITPAKPRLYRFEVEDVKLNGESEARLVQAPLPLRAATGVTPQVFMGAISNKLLPYDRGKIIVQPFGFQTKALLDAFKSNPGRIRISYRFSADDPAPNLETTASSIKGNPDDVNPTNLFIEPQDKLPLRAKKYTVKVFFPADDLRSVVSQGWEIPSDVRFIEATRVAELSPSTQTERAKTQFYFETTYTSTVDASTGNRSHIGIFGIHWKPTLPLLTYNVYAEKDEASLKKKNNPIWMAFRPLFEADFDTQSRKVSKSPNRMQFGLDYEFGRDAGLQTEGLSPIQQIVFINGLRYDSDRDFKLQTMYWHTEFVPRFLNFEQTTEMRQFQYDMETKALEARATGQAREGERKRAKGPFVSAYRIRPSVAYELGGTVRGDARSIGSPTSDISRLLFGLDLGLELKRVVIFGINNTYYFLENAPRRRHRDYLEARFELNTGYLFNRNFNGLQNAVVLKFQRGDQPPVFGPVNALSVGFKIFQ